MNGPIAYMARNHVAANILMLVLIIGGFLISRDIKQEVFPEFDLDIVTITVIYPGATPAEVEESVVQPIELAISGVNDIKRITSTSSENVGSVVVEVLENGDPDQVLQDVKAEVDRILTFPEEAERPIITKVTTRNEVMNLVLYGDVSERALMERAEIIKNELIALPDVTVVMLAAYRPYEIGIEISEENLRKYNLTLPAVSNIVRAASLDLAGGSVRTESGEVLIRTTEKRYTGADFDSIAVFTYPTGETVYLGDIANVRDEFADVDMEVMFDNQPAIMINVYRVGDQTPKEVADEVNAYIDQSSAQLPPTMHLDVIMDWSVLLQQRLDLLMRNGGLGLILVMIILALFLEIRLAFWVSMGIAISFLGSMVLLPIFGVTINMMSLFAFLIILGVVVDDAIVVGENIFVHYRMGKPLWRAAIEGAREVTLAVVFAALTTIAAFGPLLLIPGFAGKFLWVIPVIVISVLVISLVESLLILPAHLSGRLVQSKAPFWSVIEKQRSKFDSVVYWLIDKTYMQTLVWAAKNRYTTVAIAIAIFLVTIGVFAGGYIKFSFMPEIEDDAVTVSLTMPPGTAYEVTQSYAEHILQSGLDLVAEYDAQRDDGESNLQHTIMIVGSQVQRQGHSQGFTSNASHLAQVVLDMRDAEERNFLNGDFSRQWRARVGEIPGAENLTFVSDLVRQGADIEIQLSHSDFNVLLDAVERLKDMMSEYAGAEEVTDSYTEGKRELKIRLRPEAASLGITETNLAMQVRSAFYGSEALRIQRGENEVKVMVRYPEEDRRTMATIDQMRIRTADGREIPFHLAAYIEDSRGFSQITHTDRRRMVSVTAEVDKNVTTAEEILQDLEAGPLQALLADYPGLSYDLEGQSREERESAMGMLQLFAFSMILIYALLAVPFKSFLQPLIVMSAIPFGIIGAIIGHLLLGYTVSMMSMFGIIALSGVVVNSSLVLIDFINRRRREGMGVHASVFDAGKRRFRPIIMTSLTTFFGLTPMIMETSIQARFLVPMAISLGFGVLFSTGITLVLVPALYLILEDMRKLFFPKQTEEERFQQHPAIMEKEPVAAYQEEVPVEELN